ncbi:hypothetical protein CN380_20550 [Bacillus sp. AFS017274]|nr:hypothetical protein CN380_20550 [Bacillus sp. AFS017274]
MKILEKDIDILLAGLVEQELHIKDQKHLGTQVFFMLIILLFNLLFNLPIRMLFTLLFGFFSTLSELLTKKIGFCPTIPRSYEVMNKLCIND